DILERLAPAAHHDLIALLQFVNVTEEGVAMRSDHRVAALARSWRVGYVSGSDGELPVARSFDHDRVHVDAGDGEPRYLLARVRRFGRRDGGRILLFPSR